MCREKNGKMVYIEEIMVLKRVIMNREEEKVLELIKELGKCKRFWEFKKNLGI